MAAAVRVTRQKTGRALRSIVFPRNQLSPEYIAVCRELGLTAYRGTLGDWVYRPRTENGESMLRRGVRLVDAYVSLTGSNSRSLDSALDGAPVDVPASRYLRPYSVALRRLEPLRLRRIRRDLRHAARSGRTFHLWWHPHDFGLHLQQNLANLREILTCFAALRERYAMESVGMAEAAERAIVAAA